MLPDLSSLPAWAQVVAYASFGLGLAIIYLIGKAGFRQGIKSGPGEVEAHVAAVVVDPSTLKMATASVEALNMSFIELNMNFQKYLERADRQERNFQDYLILIKEFNKSLDRIREELHLDTELNRLIRRDG